MAEKSAKQAEKGFDNTGKAAKKTTGIVGELGDKVREFGPLIASYFGAQAISGVINLADNMTTLNGRIAAVTESSAEYAAVQDLIYAQAQETGTQLQANISSFTGLATGLKDLNIASSEVLQITDAVNKSLIASNATQEQATSFQLQFVQAMQSGVVQGDEFRAMMESNSVFAQQLAKALDTDIAGLRAMSSEGKLTTQVIRDAIPEMTASINTAFETVPLTIERATTQISNAFAKIISDGNEVSNGTNSIAMDISELATVVEQNAPSIQAMFGVIVTGAEVAVKGVSALEGTFKAVSAAALGVAAPIFDTIGAVTELTNAVGLTSSETDEWRISADAARAAALDLADQSNEAFQRMRGELEQNIGKEAEYKTALEANLASIEADQAAQSARSDSVVASIDKMTKAEKKAAEERQKTVESMYQTLGVGGEEYFRNEAQKLLDQAAKWEEAGADQIATQQYLYDEITKLSTEAWAAQEQSAGMYLDGLTSTFTNATVDIAADIEAVNALAIDVPADMITDPFSAGVSQVDSEVIRLTDSPAVVEITADTENFDNAAQSVNKTIAGLTGGGGGTITATLDSISAVRDQIQMLESTPTLDPFGIQRENLQARINEIQDTIAKNRAKTIAETDKNRAEWMQKEREAAREVAKSGYDDAIDALDLRLETATAKLDNAAEAEKNRWASVVSEIEAQISSLQIADFYKDPGPDPSWAQADRVRQQSWNGGFDPFRGMFGGLIGGSRFADGGVMTGHGQVDLRKYANGGVAYTPQLALFGEGRLPEAFVPLPDGRTIPVTISNESGSTQQEVHHHHQTINIYPQQKMTGREIEALIQSINVQNRRSLRTV